MKYDDLIAVLRKAGDVDRSHVDGSGPMTFCHEAADAIESAAADVELLEADLEVERTRNASYRAKNDDLAADVERLERENAELRAVIEQVRKYARDREAYGRQGRTAHSARIASDLVAVLSTSPAEALNAVKAAVWDECLDAIEENEINTDQARAGNPYRTEGNGHAHP